MTKKMVAVTDTLRPAVMLTQEVIKKFSAVENGLLGAGGGAGVSG